MDKEKIELCLRNSEECRNRAQAAIFPAEKAAWFQLAQGWLDLAETTRMQESKPPTSVH